MSSAVMTVIVLGEALATMLLNQGHRMRNAVKCGVR